jgi:hypothetical protein
MGISNSSYGWYPTITSGWFPGGNRLAISRLPGQLRELQERFTAKLSGNFSGIFEQIFKASIPSLSW